MVIALLSLAGLEFFKDVTAWQAAICGIIGGSCLVYAFARRSGRAGGEGRRAAPPAGDVEVDPGVQQALEAFAEETRMPVTRLTATPGSAGPFSSKLGGVVYNPPGFAWPVGGDGEPLVALAQLNFAELPPLEGFPAKGILQFFIGGDESPDSYGADLGNPLDQAWFRVVYHQDVGEETNPPPAAGLADAERELPLSEELVLEGVPGAMAMPIEDWRFEGEFWASLDRKLKAGAITVSDESAERAAERCLEWEDYGLFDSTDAEGHHLGGYARFVQEDPRLDNPDLSGHTAVLLQIGSDDHVSWGDVGVGVFLIEPDRLRRGDFSNVAYYWDCS